MAWEEELVPLLRGLVGDLDSPTIYSDVKLEQALVLGAHLLFKEVSFNKTYTVTISTTTITPDPTDDPVDVAFINLVCLRTAVLIVGGELRIAANYFNISDAGASISAGNVYKNKKDLYEALLKQFNQAKFDYSSGNSRIGHAILTPYTNELLSYGGFIPR